MADPKKSRKDQSSEPEVKARKKPKAKKPASESAVVKTAPARSFSQKAKAARIAKQQEATERNKELRRLGQRTPLEQAKLERKIARDCDPIIKQRRLRRQNDQVRAENARILAKAELEAKAATEAISRVHSTSSV